MIELKDGLYYKAVWNFEFVPGARNSVIPTPDRPGNLLGAMFSEDPERKKWIIVYRFRYYVDDIMDSSSADEKSWYRVAFDSEEESGWNKTHEAFSLMASVCGSTLNVAMIESDIARVQIIALESLPNMSIRSVPKEELAKHLPNEIAKTHLN